VSESTSSVDKCLDHLSLVINQRTLWVEAAVALAECICWGKTKSKKLTKREHAAMVKFSEAMDASESFIAKVIVVTGEGEA
jgi:hypothetical protein